MFNDWLFPYWEKKSFQVHGQKSARGKSFIWQFLLSVMKNVINKATEYVTSVFPFVFWFLPFLGNLESDCLQALQIFQWLSSHNPRKFWQMILGWDWRRLCPSLSEQGGAKGKRAWYYICMIKSRYPSDEKCFSRTMIGQLRSE